MSQHENALPLHWYDDVSRCLRSGELARIIDSAQREIGQLYGDEPVEMPMMDLIALRGAHQEIGKIIASVEEKERAA